MEKHGNKLLHYILMLLNRNKVDAEHEAELARNIKRKMKEYNIPADSVGPDNRLRKYL